MSEYRNLAKNVGLLTLANFGTKILSFALVPLYTSVLTTAEYGTFDLANTTIVLLMPLFTQNIADGVLRFTLEKDVDNNSALGIGLKYAFLSLIPMTIGLSAISLLGFFPEVAQYAPLIMLLYLGQVLSSVLLSHAQGLNQFRDVAISSVICSSLIIGCNVIFLLPLHMQLTGYFAASTIGPLAQIAYLVLRLKQANEEPAAGDRKLESEMLRYSRPLIVNNVAWWVNSASDRYIVTFFCGVQANGLYSVAAKIPSILSVIQSIISQAWTISAVTEFDPEDRTGFFSNMYAGYNCVMTVICSLIIAANMLLARLLYANEFFIAWQYAPFLTVSVVFGALTGYIGGILAAAKDSKEFARTSSLGAASNVMLNLVLVPLFGPLGAAFSTLFCYWLIWFLRIRRLKKYINIKINLTRDHITYAILLIQSTAFLVLTDLVEVHILQACLFLTLSLLYHREIHAIACKAMAYINRQRG